MMQQSQQKKLIWRGRYGLRSKMCQHYHEELFRNGQIWFWCRKQREILLELMNRTAWHLWDGFEGGGGPGSSLNISECIRPYWDVVSDEMEKGRCICASKVGYPYSQDYRDTEIILTVVRWHIMPGNRPESAFICWVLNTAARGSCAMTIINLQSNENMCETRRSRFSTAIPRMGGF